MTHVLLVHLLELLVGCDKGIIIPGIKLVAQVGEGIGRALVMQGHLLGVRPAVELPEHVRRRKPDRPTGSSDPGAGRSLPV